eukprot:SAG11_NODE_2583_length_3195_cov_188.324935_5_plen_164_part_01
MGNCLPKSKTNPLLEGLSTSDIAEPEPAVVPEPALDADGFVFDGVKPQALMRLLEIYPEILEKKLTTSDVCHTILKPMTVPAGWVNKPTVTNPKESWYRHQYHPTDQPDSLQDAPPPGTCSYAEILKKDPELKHLVGKPTVFWSHPWKDQFSQVVTSICEQYPD